MRNAPCTLMVANRTPKRGSRLTNCSAVRRFRLRTCLSGCTTSKIVTSCTASSLPTSGLDAVERAIKALKHRPVFKTVFLYTVDRAAVLEALSQALPNKFVHRPTHALTRACSGDRDKLVDLLSGFYRDLGWSER